MLRRDGLGVRLLLAVSMVSTCVPHAFAQELPDLSAKYDLGGSTPEVVVSTAVTMLQRFAPANVANTVAAFSRAGGCLQEAGVVTGGIYVSRQDRAAMGILIVASKSKSRNWSVLLNYQMVGLEGSLSADQRTITGRITNSQCGAFTLTRAQ